MKLPQSVPYSSLLCTCTKRNPTQGLHRFLHELRWKHRVPQAFQNGRAAAERSSPPPRATGAGLGSFPRHHPRKSPLLWSLPPRDSPIPIPRTMPGASSLDNRKSSPFLGQHGRQEDLPAFIPTCPSLCVPHLLQPGHKKIKTHI